MPEFRSFSAQGPPAAWYKHVARAGIATIADAYTDRIISDWNSALDPIFVTRRGDRSYVAADELADLGIISQIMTPAVRSIVTSTVPRARIYHCHAYEIDAYQSQPHVHGERADGWHRDIETIRFFARDRARHVSLFVYLSEVGEDGGAFEFVPRDPSGPPPRGTAAHRVVGPAGTAFVWNRSYYHRASPNLSPTRRRVLKLSWQEADLPNDRIGTDEFRRAASALPEDPFLQGLFGLDRAGELPREVTPPVPVCLPLNSSVSIRRSDQLYERARVLLHQVHA